MRSATRYFIVAACFNNYSRKAVQKCVFWQDDVGLGKTNLPESAWELGIIQPDVPPPFYTGGLLFSPYPVISTYPRPTMFPSVSFATTAPSQ